eukprot:7157386-Prorocentrum_lima.AAC.1
MDKDSDVAQLFQYGGTCHSSIDFEGTGLQHILHRLGKYFKEHNHSEILRISTEYANFSRRPGDAVEEAIARFDLLHSIAMTQG